LDPSAFGEGVYIEKDRVAQQIRDFIELEVFCGASNNNKRISNWSCRP
jgi:hypothetical protein